MAIVSEDTIKEWFYKGNALRKEGRFEEAATAFRAVLTLYPGAPEALGNLGLVLYHLRRYEEAREALEEAVRICPTSADAFNTLGGVYRDSGQNARAILAWRKAVALKPDYLNAWYNLGLALYNNGDQEGAIAAYESALRINPDHAIVLAELIYRLHSVCRWKNLKELMVRLERILAKGEQVASPFIVDFYTSPAQQLQNAEKFVAQFYPGNTSYNSKTILPSLIRKDGKLHIGYLSSDFGAHATSFLISELFEQHDRKQFEICIYSSANDDSAQSQRIGKAADRFRDISRMDNAAAFECIIQDGIDILVDLKGHTQDNRMDVMASRPAPLQMHYLGFPGTTGASCIDYFISDAVLSPPDTDKHFSECLIRLPHSYQINDRKRLVPKQALPRAHYGLPEGSFVFCDFNHSYKITPAVFDIWMRLLAKVEGSVLWLLECNKEASVNVRHEAMQRGIDASRIILAPIDDQAAHLARYRHVDLVLDTFPVVSHTTASDALWCGVPVVTMIGETFISRVAASLLHAVGLPELVTHSFAQYEALALSLAKDKDKLDKLKQRLETDRMQAPLFDSLATTRALEAAYLHAAALHARGLSPRPFSISPDLHVL